MLIRGLTITGRAGAGKRVKYRNGAATWVDEPVFWVDDYAAAADGSTDDSGAYALARADAVAAISAGAARATVKFSPKRSYRIAASLAPASYLTIDATDAKLIGPITGYGRISGATTVPAATDVTGQAGGGCISDVASPTSTREFRLIGGTITGFRYGVSSVGQWGYPLFTDVQVVSTDIAFFAYQGSQNWKWLDCHGSVGCWFAGVATCFATGNAYAGLDNIFADNISYDSHKELTCTISANVDTWFEAAILRPSTASVSVVGSKTYAPTGTFRAVTGRALFLPSRNDRAVYHLNVPHMMLWGVGRGGILVRNPSSFYVGKLSGENSFQTATGDSEAMIQIGVQAGNYGGVINNTDGDNTTGTNYTHAVRIVPETGSIGGTRFVGNGIIGKVDPEYWERVSAFDQRNNITLTAQRASRRYPLASKQVLTDLTTSYRVAPRGESARWADPNATGRDLRETTFFGRLPLASGAQTFAVLDIVGATPGSNSTLSEGMGQPIVGTADIWIVRHDTGEVDFARYPVMIGNRAVSTTLAANATVGDTTITVAGSETLFVPGTPILIAGTDKHRVKSVNTSTKVITLDPAKAIATSRASGSTVAIRCDVGTAITAFAQNWATFTSTSNELRVTNTIAPIPISFRVLFRHVGYEV